MKMKWYEIIIAAVEEDFNEYFDKKGKSITETVCCILDDSLQVLSIDRFSRFGYLLRLSLECLKRNEIPDLVYEYMKSGMDLTPLEDCEDQTELRWIEADLELCGDLLSGHGYQVTVSADGLRARLLYLAEGNI